MSTTSAPRDSSTIASQVAGALIGAAAGIAVGLVLAQRFGGAGGIAARFAGRPEDDAAPGLAPGFDADWDGADDAIEDDLDDEVDDALGERVLEVFTNDPLLAERAIDIEVQPGATVELTGWVDAEREVEYAATLAGGVPGVRHVITQLGVEGKGWGPRRG